MSWTHKNLSWTDRHLNWTTFLVVLGSNSLLLLGAEGYLFIVFIGFGVFAWHLHKKMRSLFWLILVPIPFGWLFLLSLENFNMALVLGDYEDEDDSDHMNYDEE